MRQSGNRNAKEGPFDELPTEDKGKNIGPRKNLIEKIKWPMTMVTQRYMINLMGYCRDKMNEMVETGGQRTVRIRENTMKVRIVQKAPKMDKPKSTSVAWAITS